MASGLGGSSGSGNIAGFWEPHTSSIDFCETNYVHSHHVAEFHNTWSSLIGIAMFGLIGMVAANPMREWRYRIAYAILWGIGIGSAGLHGSLHWIFQSSDELPMLYLVTCLNYMALEYNAPIGKANYPGLATACVVLSIVNTVVYYRFQEIYLVFVMSYSAGVVVLSVLGYRIISLQQSSTKRRSQTARNLGFLSAASYLLLGVPVWVLDMLQCHNMVAPVADQFPGLWKGFTPHVVWHFAAGFGTYCALACLCCCRMEELEVPYLVEYVFGIMPTLSTVQNKKD